MLRNLLFAIGSAILVGCGNVPQKPEVEMCFVETPAAPLAHYCLCGIAPGGGMKLKAKKLERHPIEYCDKATSFRPREWEKIQNYQDELLDYALKHCR
jgi:hypothetical protein